VVGIIGEYGNGKTCMANVAALLIGGKDLYAVGYYLPRLTEEESKFFICFDLNVRSSAVNFPKSFKYLMVCGHNDTRARDVFKTIARTGKTVYELQFKHMINNVDSNMRSRIEESFGALYRLIVLGCRIGNMY
jgi:hypothetical protein